LNPKTSKREARRKLAARIVAGIMAALMVGGSAYYVIYMLVVSASAAAPVGNLNEDLNIRVGLMYGDGVTVGFETETTNGYTVGVQPLRDDVFNFTPFWQLDSKLISVAADANLTKKDRTYSITKKTSGVAVGGYHIEFGTNFGLADAVYARQLMQTLDDLLVQRGLYSFPVYINGHICIRVGSFASQAAAAEIYPYVSAVMAYFTSYIVGPSATAVTVLDPQTDRILFEYECSDGTSLGLSAVDSPDGPAYIKTPANNIYDGVFAYNRHQEEGVDGVAVTNVLTLDEYVEGVLPFEVSNVWPAEALKAFAIAARSYAASTLDRHENAYSFDLCNGSHCQMYKGAGRVNDNVIAAVQSTHGLIITYKGKIASTYYSSSCGGITVSIGDVWGGSASPYLVAHETPWERYSEHNNGLWIVEVSPTELLKYLKETKEYSQLSGYVKRIEVLEYAPGSTYVKRLRITDSKGTSIELNNTDRVRSTLGAYLKSANFVVGQGSVNYTVDTVSVAGEVVIDVTKEKQVRPPVNMMEAGVQAAVLSANTLPVLTANSVQTVGFSDAMILTANELLRNTSTEVFVQTESTQYHLSSKPAQSDGTVVGIPRVVKEYSVTTEQKTATAASAQNFIFVGKGWGHGAGMSQYGTKDLADLGYGYEHIINAYYTDVEIVYYKTIEGFQ